MIFVGGRVEVSKGAQVEGYCPRKPIETTSATVKVFEITQVFTQSVEIRTLPGVELVEIK